MGGWLQDLTVTVRSLARRPGLTVAVVLTTALGIGATTTVYSVVDGVLLRPLPHPEPDRIAVVGTTFPGREWADAGTNRMHLAGTSMLNYLDLRERARSFSSLGALEPTSVLLPDAGRGPELAQAARVNPAFFETLGAQVERGRLFGPGDGGGDAVVLSHAAWVQRLGADPGAVGRSVEMVGATGTVVGVLPRDFTPPEAVTSGSLEFYLPLDPTHPRYASRGARSLVLLGRLAPGATLNEAREELGAIADALAVEHPDGNVYPDGSHFGAGANTLLQETVGGTVPILGIFLGASILLLLISVLNSTGLLLARGLDRRRELGIRAALGAGRRRLARLVVVEGVLLALVGGALGVGLAGMGVAAFRELGPATLPRLGQVAVDGRVLLASTLLSLVVGVASAVIPTLRLPVGRSGIPGSRSPGEDRTTTRLRGALVSAQVAVAVVLLTGAGLLLHSFVRLQTVDPGFDAADALAFRVATKRPGAPAEEEPWQAWERVLNEVSAVPGVSAVAAASDLPYQSTSWAPLILLDGETAETRREGIAGYAVTPGYLETLGIQLLAGRGLPIGGAGGPWSVVVNEAFVRQVLGGAEAVGTGLRVSSLGPDEELQPAVVVGVVETVVQERLEDGPRPAVYMAQRQANWPAGAQLVVRSSRALDDLVPELRAAVARFNPVVPIRGLASFQARAATRRATPRFRMLLLATFAGVALLLAVTGLYGTMAHAVRRRRPELGVRMALGARHSSLVGLVLREGLILVGAGLAVGLAGALLLQRVLEGFLFQVEALDPLTLAGVAGTLLVGASVASLLPALQAIRVEPLDVLQAD